MTPAKRRPATPARKGPASVAPDVPTVADPPPAAPGPDALVIASVPRAKKTLPTETEQPEAEDRATTQSPRRPLSLYPLPVWPD